MNRIIDIDTVEDIEWIATYEDEFGDLFISNPGNKYAINRWMHEITDDDPDEKYTFNLYRINQTATVSVNGTKKGNEPS